MIPIPRSGTLRAVEHVDDVRSVRHVTGVEITVPLGQRIRALPEGDRYLGFVFASGPSPEAVGAALREAKDRLEVVVDPEPVPATDTVIG